MRPFSPEDVDTALARGDHLPDGVISAINQLLVKHGSSRVIVLSLDEVKKAVAKELGFVHVPEKVKKEWLDFERVYNAVGWSVSFYSPSYDESGAPHYTFKRPK